MWREEVSQLTCLSPIFPMFVLISLLISSKKGSPFPFSRLFLYLKKNFFRVAPEAYGSSQARGRIGAAADGLRHSQCWIRAKSATYTTAHGNAGSLTHWARPGIKLASWWILVRFLTCWATMGTPPDCSFKLRIFLPPLRLLLYINGPLITLLFSRSI